jgi:hypothetical protein
VKRVLAGEAPANLVALVQRYFGLDYETWGKDAFAATTLAGSGGRHDPALRFLEGDTIGLLVLAEATIRSPRSRASCRRRRGCARRSTGR